MFNAVDYALPIQVAPTVGDELSIVVLDTETTGLDFRNCKIIELGLVKAKYSPSKCCITSITDIYDEFEDPHEEIDPIITKITGITTDDVRGKFFDVDKISRIFSDDPLVIAHNAAFDRPFFDKRFSVDPVLQNLQWTCSLRNVNWGAVNKDLIFSRSLESLAFNSGFFYDAHRAINDVLSTLWLLNYYPLAFKNLMDTTFSGNIITIWAFGLDKSLKDEVKKRGYRWNSFERVWNKVCINELQLNEEANFLRQLYDPQGMYFKVSNMPKNPRASFKAV